METKNLPATNQEINLFTTGKNVESKKVKEVEKLLKEAKKVKISNSSSFNFIIYKNIYDLNNDTFKYVIENYGFENEEVIRNSRNEIFFNSKKTIKNNFFEIDIEIRTKAQKINLMPNDVSKVING